ncbi:MAG: hypothetical protein RBS16_01895 [Candidatus Cloacimonadales bacterium]|jgi:hypothetical protein|nr:hypothetical protein [Candidatus Cloacimonadota bacterium]MDD3501775.1 hypothetical protein [Candidatus Cloacimonadota bacterium]MDX9976765.1 hypothetical protein [Candidatus Cloacimonadales bacterium]
MVFKLIKIKDGLCYIMLFDDAIINYTPSVKYKVEKKNAFDPSIVVKRHQYRQDDFECSVICNPDSNYSNALKLIDFLSDEAVFYIETEVNNEPLQRMITYIELPVIKNDARVFTDLIKFKLSSIYKEHNYIDFSNLYGYGNNYGACYGF